MKKKYLKYDDYKNKTIADIFTPEQVSTAAKKEAFILTTCVLWNRGGGKFDLAPLPRPAQQTPVFAISTADFTGDGKHDILLAGNHERCKPETGIYLGSYGCLLQGDGKGNFLPVRQTRTGLKLGGSVRGLAVIHDHGHQQLLVAHNNGPLQCFRTAQQNKAQQ